MVKGKTLTRKGRWEKKFNSVRRTMKIDKKHAIFGLYERGVGGRERDMPGHRLVIIELLS